MFNPIITTLDGGGVQGRNKQKRYRQTLLVTDAGSQLTSEIGEGGEVGISTNFTDAESQLREGGRAGISKNVTDAGSQLRVSKNVTDVGSQLTF